MSYGAPVPDLRSVEISLLAVGEVQALLDEKFARRRQGLRYGGREIQQMSRTEESPFEPVFAEHAP